MALSFALLLLSFYLHFTATTRAESQWFSVELLPARQLISRWGGLLCLLLGGGCRLRAAYTRQKRNETQP